jgi:hypothetical protein
MLKVDIRRLLGITAIVLCFATGSDATSAASVQQFEGAKQIPVAPPPMGWSSWNSFADTVDSAVIMQQTKSLVASGMQKAGYRYVNIDEGWWLGKRDEDGNIVVDPKQWPALKQGEQPGDMSNIVRYIHSFGLKAGIYTDVGESGCGFYGPAVGPPRPHTGSEDHYDRDFLQFAKWGFDYVKVDWCGGYGEELDPAAQYLAVAHAIQRAEQITGHPLYFSICDWGKNSPWTWAPGIGGVAADIWRTSGDIVAPVVVNTPTSTRLASFSKVLSNFDHGIHPEAQHTGFYNDPDMMVIGMPGLSEAQNRVHMSLWAISSAPLIVGADVSRLNKSTIEILTNPEVIAVDQDSLGLQAILVAQQPATDLQVWSKPLSAAGEHAVVMLNRTSTPAKIAVRWSEIGLVPSSSATVRDLWAAKDLGTYQSSYAATIPAGDAVMLRIRGTDEKPIQYEPVSQIHSANSDVPGGEQAVTFNTAQMQGPAYVRIDYRNNGPGPRAARLKVNGQMAMNVRFPPTTSAKAVGTITIEVNFDQTRKRNVLTFFSPRDHGLVLKAIAVLGGDAAFDHPESRPQ